MEKGEILLPKDYRIFEREDVEMMGNGREEFAIKNRSYFDIDKYFSNSISAAINERLKENNMVYVLDLAGGIKSKAVRDIENNKDFEGRVKALNIDIAQAVKEGKEANRVQGDAASLPLADSSVDIVYSRQFLPFVRQFSHEHSIKMNSILSEVARVLRPEGVAFLDDEEELSGDRSEDKRRKIAENLGVVIESEESSSLVFNRKFLPRLWQNSLRLEKFLVMKKN